jgi:hypothetical protein
MPRNATPNALLALLCAGAATAQAQNLFFGSAGFNGSQDAIYSTDLNGAGLHNILPSPMVVSGVAADGASRMVFWQQPHHGQNQRQWSIHASDFSGGSHAVIANWTSAGGNNYGVAVDSVSKRVYWTDLNGINSANYNGTGATTVVSSFNPTEVDVDPASNKLFWTTDNGSSVQIWSAALNGTGATTLATLPANTYVFGIALNPGTQTLYWSDYIAGTVSALPYAGGTPTTILSGYQFVQGLEYEATTNRLYMVNKGTASVAWMNPAGGPVTTVFTGSGQTLGEMHDIAAVVPAPGAVALLACGAILSRRRRN